MKEEEKESPNQSKATPKQPSRCSNEGSKDLFSPRFRSVAAMAGWDEEAIIIATVVVEDTPEREIKHRKRSDPLFKTPPTNSRRKRRVSRAHALIPVPVLNLEEEETTKKECDQIEKENGKEVKDIVEKNGISSTSSSILCLDKLREELSCAICLEICFEPTTTQCGHSFCKKCLRYSADKCGKRCPKCRQLISNGRSCTVNTVLWNTIQLLFPQEVEARMKAKSTDNQEGIRRHKTVASSRNNVHNVGTGGTLGISTRERRRRVVNQDEDAALALRLQREEFMEAFRGSSTSEQGRSSSAALARANLRAMASRAMSLRARGRHAY